MLNTLAVDSKTLSLDKEGFLQDLDDWSPEVAAELARKEEIILTESHWEIINIVRNFHEQRGLSPVISILIKLIHMAHGPEKGNSLYLMSLFPNSPAKSVSRIAGLPRPANCH